MKKVFIILIPIILIPLLGFGVIWLANYKTTFPVPASRSNTDFIIAIAHNDRSLFTKEGQPVFVIKNVKKITIGWYEVEIQAKENPESIKGKVIIKDPYFDASYMSMVAGPESSFSQIDLAQYSIPEAVIKEVTK